MSGTGRAATAGRWALAAVVLVLLVVPGRLLASEHADDDALVPYGDRPAPSDRVLRGQTWEGDAGVVAARSDRLTVVEVRPRVTVDTAQAEITVRLCTPAAGGGCASVSDVPTHGRVVLEPGAARLLVSVTPSRSGRVQIEGYDVTYDDGRHRGTEHAGRPLHLRAV